MKWDRHSRRKLIDYLKDSSKVFQPDGGNVDVLLETGMTISNWNAILNSAVINKLYVSKLQE